jgi:hypothetical protein
MAKAPLLGQSVAAPCQLSGYVAEIVFAVTVSLGIDDDNDFNLALWKLRRHFQRQATIGTDCPAGSKHRHDILPTLCIVQNQQSYRAPQVDSIVAQHHGRIASITALPIIIRA